MRTVEFFVNRAQDSFEAGFKTATAKKAASKDLNSAFDLLMDQIRDCHLNADERSDETYKVYWGVPSYVHQWRKKHEDLVLSVFPEMKDVVQQVNTLVEFNKAIKESEIIVVEKCDKVEEYTTRVHQSIEAFMKDQKEKFQYGLKLVDVFGYLPVTVNVHWVTHQKGTEFKRCFYYLNGRITRLGTIIAILEETSED